MHDSPSEIASEPEPARALSTSARLALAAIGALPRNALSRAMGSFAGLRLPAPLARLVVTGFGRAVGVDFSEIRDPIDRFRSLQEFFTRALREGVRPIDPAPDAFVSPCDGAWGASGRVARGTLLQVKGRSYSLAALLGDDAEAARFEGGAYATLYLSPRDYHRFHAPCAMRALRLRHVPGALWPVNRLGVEGVDALFARNERLVALFSLDAAGELDLAIVAVGATMVGRVRVGFDDLTTNRRAGRVATRDYAGREVRIAKGAEWGRFELGSTLVLIARPSLLQLDDAPPGTPLRLGTRIGTLAR